MRETAWGRGMLTWMLVVLSVAGGWSQARINFETTRQDLGTIKEEDGPAETIFKFTNTGNAPLVLTSVKPGCGCTTPIWSRDSIPPGSEGFIKVSYNPANRPGAFKKYITVRSNGIPDVKVLHIVGNVTPRPKGPRDFYPFEEGNIRFKTNHLAYSTLYKGEERTETTILYNQGDKPIRFLPGQTEVPPFLKLALSKPLLQPGDTLTMSLTYVADAKDDWGYCFDNLYLATNDDSRPMKRLNISVQVMEKLSKAGTPARLRLDKTEYDLGEVIQGEQVSLEVPIRNGGGAPLLIRKVSSQCSCISAAVNADTIPPGESGLVLVTLNTRGRIGHLEKEVTIICNDPYRPELQLMLNTEVIRDAKEEEPDPLEED